jgi:hypothetical protein
MSTSNLYPFTTRKQIIARLADEVSFRREVIVMLFQKQTEHEQATKSTLNKNKVGFMSSHAVHGTTIAKKILAGEKLTADENDRVDAIAPRYSRQVALFMRADAIKANPDLAKVAAIFSADQNLPEAAPVAEPEVVTDEEIEPAEDLVTEEDETV